MKITDEIYKQVKSGGDNVRRFIEHHDDTASKIHLGTKYDETIFV